MNRTFAIFIFSAFFLSGCIITSFNPFYTKSDLIVNETLYGNWIGQKSILTIEKLGESSYQINYKDCEDPINAPNDYSSCTMADFTGNLMKLEDNFYLNLSPRSYVNSDNLFLGFHIKAAHSLAKINIEKTYLEIRLISYAWMTSHLEKNKNALDHIKIDNVITLTASTSELQEFILKHQNTPGFFDNPIILIKKAS